MERELTPRQLELAHQFLRGRSEEEILQALRMQPEEMQEIVALKDFQVYIADFEIEVRNRILKSSSDVKEMLDAASILCTRVLAMAATSGIVNDERISAGMQLKTAQDLLDRAGFPAVKTNVSNNGVAINIGGDIQSIVDVYEKRKALEVRG